MFIAVLCTVAETWKQPKCPSAAEWIKKMWCIHTLEYCPSKKKKNEIMPFAATWVDLEILMLSEVRQRQFHMIMWNLIKMKQNPHLQNRNNSKSNVRLPKGKGWGVS